LLLTDGAGPLFDACRASELGAAVRDAISALR
jgi:hypothetical protein